MLNVRAVLEIQFNEPNELKSAHHINSFSVLLKAVLFLLLLAAQKLIYFLSISFCFSASLSSRMIDLQLHYRRSSRWILDMAVRFIEIARIG